MKISDLNELTSVSGTEKIPVGTGGSNAFAVTINRIKTFVAAALSTATSSAAGLMSATDKSKLDGIAAGAQVNPANYVKTVASTCSDGTEIATVTLQDNSTVTLKAPTSGGGTGGGTITGVKIGSTTIATSGVATIPLATASNDGAMSKGDKSLINNINVAGIKVVSSEVSASDNILYIVLGS